MLAQNVPGLVNLDQNLWIWIVIIVVVVVYAADAGRGRRGRKLRGGRRRLVGGPASFGPSPPPWETPIFWVLLLGGCAAVIVGFNTSWYTQF